MQFTEAGNRLTLRALALVGAAVALDACAHYTTVSGAWPVVGWLDLVGVPLLLALAGLHLVVSPRSAGVRVGVAFAYSGLVLALWLPAIVPGRCPSDDGWRIVVDKGRRTLVATHDGKTVRECRVSLGPGVGPKEHEGDKRTPEGVYRLSEKVEGVYHKWLGVSYPGLDDADRGLRGGHLSWYDYRAIRVAQLHGQLPPEATWLGGNLGIHGGGTKGDWTLGCIAVDDADVDALYEVVPVGATIEIRP